MSGLDEHQGAALADALGAYMGLLNTVATVARPTQDDERVEALRTEFDAAIVRYRERSRARQEAAEAADRA